MPGVLLATLGPGVANAVNVVANAEQDRVPLVFITGCVDPAEAAGYTHQVFDHGALLKPITKASFQLTAGVVGLQVVLFGLVVRCAVLQLGDKKSEFDELQQKYLNASYDGAAPRGRIRAAGGETLVRNRSRWRVAIDPNTAGGKDDSSLEHKRARVAAALDVAERCVNIQPKDPYVVDTLACCLYAVGRDGEAIQMIRRSIDLDPENPQWRKRLEEFQSGKKQEG